MNTNINKIVLYLIITTGIVFAQSGGIDKVGTTSFQFLKVMSDARSTGMGEAFVSVTDNSNSVFWNPAGLSKVNNFDVSFSYVDWFLDVKHLALSASYNLGDFGTIGLQALMNDVGEIEVTRVSELYRDAQGNYNPGLTGETIKPGSKVFGLSYARQLTDKFSFGITAKFAHEDLVVKSASTLMFDAGLLYKTGFRSIEIAAALRNFGPEIKYSDQPYPLPQTFQIGISANILSNDNPLFFKTVDQNLLLAFSISQPRDYGQQYQIGLEYSLYNMFFLRGGYKFNYDEEGLSLGAGVNYNSYRIDYSINDYGEYLGYIHRFTIGFGIN